MSLPVFDAVSESAVGTVVSTRSWTHTTGTLTRGCLVVATGARENTTPGNLVVSSVTYGGVALEKKIESVGARLGTSLWIMRDPPAGAATVLVTWTGTINDVLTACALSYSNVSNIVPVHATRGNTVNASATAISEVITTTIPDCLIIDSMYQTDDLGVTVGGGQTARSNRIVTGVNTDAVGVSQESASLPGTTTMSWTANTYDYSMSIIALVGADITRFPQLEKPGLRPRPFSPG